MAKNRRRARKDSYLSKRKQRNKRFLRIAAGLVIVASLGFFYLNSAMNKEHEDMNKDIISGQKKLEDIKTEIDELKNDYEMRNTDQFKEKVAKEKLGMVKKGEEDKDEGEANSVIKPVNPNQEDQTNPDSQANQTTNENNQANPNNNQNSKPNANQNANPNENQGTNLETNENGR